MKFKIKFAAIALGGIALAVAGCSQAESGHSVQTTKNTEGVHAPAPAGSGLQQVALSQVCMVNDRFMGRTQIPVEVGGKTYYGCCPACKQKLATQAAFRTAVDPISGRPVDKATALVVALPGDQVLYFENQETLATYKKRGNS